MGRDALNGASSKPQFAVNVKAEKTAIAYSHKRGYYVHMTYWPFAYMGRVHGFLGSQ